jgi:hypothetical protein
MKNTRRNSRTTEQKMRESHVTLTQLRTPVKQTAPRFVLKSPQESFGLAKSEQEPPAPKSDIRPHTCAEITSLVVFDCSH